jgi:hypothetical protein
MRGAGNIVTEAREVSGFDEVHLAGEGVLTIVQGEAESLTIEAEEGILPLIETTVSGGRLEIRYRKGWTSPRPTVPVRYNLGVKTLRAVHSSGSAEIRAASLRAEQLEIVVSGSGDVTLGQLTAESLRAVISGSGRFRVAGEATHQRVEISGSGSYSADGATSRDAEIAISGSGRALVRVSEELEVRISGSGEVEYIGDPRVSRRVSGAGRVTRRAAA